MADARDQWQTAHERELPWFVNMPDDPWDDSLI